MTSSVVLANFFICNDGLTLRTAPWGIENARGSFDLVLFLYLKRRVHRAGSPEQSVAYGGTTDGEEVLYLFLSCAHTSKGSLFPSGQTDRHDGNVRTFNRAGNN